MTALHEDRAAAEAAAAKLKNFAQPQRLMILSCLLKGERNVGEIDAATGIGQPMLSQQLAALRKADLVATRREGTQKYYSITDENTVLCIQCLNLIANDGIELKGELRKTLQKPRSGPLTSSPRSGVAGFARVLD
jgi:DNA-binding transcriptional ArsR family regulator